MNDTHNNTHNQVKIKVNLKLTGTAILDVATGKLDWGTTRLHGSLIPVFKDSGEETVGKPKPLSQRVGEQFLTDISAHFSGITNIYPPSSRRSSVYIQRWRNPFLAILRQVWATAGYNPASRNKAFVEVKYSSLPLGATRRVIEASIKSLGEFSISSPQSLEKTAINLARQDNYIQVTIDENKAKGVTLSIPQRK